MSGRTSSGQRSCKNQRGFASSCGNNFCVDAIFCKEEEDDDAEADVAVRFEEFFRSNTFRPTSFKAAGRRRLQRIEGRPFAVVFFSMRMFRIETGFINPRCCVCRLAAEGGCACRSVKGLGTTEANIMMKGKDTIGTRNQSKIVCDAELFNIDR